MTATVSLRGLNRATLARQWLLDRREARAADAIEHLVGMQSQAPNAPYVGLWSRLAGFDAAELSALMEERRAVRAPLMRATIHLVTADDCVALRPAVHAALEQQFRGSPFPRLLDGVDPAPVVTAGVRLLADQPRTRAQLGPLLAPGWPDIEPDALSYAVTYLAPLVQVTPRGVWGRSGASAWAPVAAWLGREVGPALPADELVRRYLAAFGPATVMDVQAWSGLTRLGEVVDRMAPDLVRLRDDDGRELFDLPGAPRPIPTRRRRSGSCPSTSTRSSGTRTAPASCPTAGPHRCTPATAPSRARCWSTGGWRGSGASPAPAAPPGPRPRCASSRGATWAWWPRRSSAARARRCWRSWRRGPMPTT